MVLFFCERDEGGDDGDRDLLRPLSSFSSLSLSPLLPVEPEDERLSWSCSSLPSVLLDILVTLTRDLVTLTRTPFFYRIDTLCRTV